MFERFAEAGGTLIDTAESYQLGESETILADLIARRSRSFRPRDQVQQTAPRVSTTGNSRKNMIRAGRGQPEATEDRLHRPLLGALRRRRDADRGDPARASTIWSAPARSSTRACRTSRPGASRAPQTIAELRGWSPISASRSSTASSSAPPTASCCRWPRRSGSASTLWSPLGGGLLTGKYRLSRRGPDHRRSRAWCTPRDSLQKTAVVDEVLAIADQSASRRRRWRWPGCASATRARRRRWSRSSARATSPNSRTISAALDVTLTTEQSSPPGRGERARLGVPHEVIANVRNARAGRRREPLRHARRFRWSRDAAHELRGRRVPDRPSAWRRSASGGRS